MGVRPPFETIHPGNVDHPILEVLGAELGLGVFRLHAILLAVKGQLDEPGGVALLVPVCGAELELVGGQAVPWLHFALEVGREVEVGIVALDEGANLRGAGRAGAVGCRE